MKEALEMSEHLEDINYNARILLDLWQEEMEIVSRPHLLQHLSSIGMQKKYTCDDCIIDGSILGGALLSIPFKFQPCDHTPPARVVKIT